MTRAGQSEEENSWRSGQQLSSSNQAENLINAYALGFGMQGKILAFM